jgi:hypothetical protein
MGAGKSWTVLRAPRRPVLTPSPTKKLFRVERKYRSLRCIYESIEHAFSFFPRPRWRDANSCGG